mmetsp:Transcript_1944/g.3367  ORF Transcript_1944/g.3367 Transcript_1944/m.3367 type:complete len:254 (-) Transcript_1944:426-1187(-)
MVKDHAKVGTQAEINLRSDPIFGSLGPLPQENKPITEEQKLEADLNSRKPVRFEFENDIHPETQASIEWAEKLLGSTMPVPTYEDEKDKEPKFGDKAENFEYDDDGDIKTTLDSAFQAESMYGYHQRYGYGYGYDNTHANTTTYDSNSKDYQKNYTGGFDSYGYQHEHPDWWNHLVKDTGYEGMVSTHPKSDNHYMTNTFEDYYTDLYKNNNKPTEPAKPAEPTKPAEPSKPALPPIPELTPPAGSGQAPISE